ncbi:hypothetical protein [Streptomyces sp. NPDC096032]|uniref:hypothetical protein n=1 Tax=Streptomyces sp. NPDC096032 TaxID=3366070 RepID=UPI003810F08A
MTVAAGAAVGLVALAVGRRLAFGVPAAVRMSLPAVPVIVATVSAAWWLSATRGTLDGCPGHSGICPASDVPPSWPAWIPV